MLCNTNLRWLSNAWDGKTGSSMLFSGKGFGVLRATPFVPLILPQLKLFLVAFPDEATGVGNLIVADQLLM